MYLELARETSTRKLYTDELQWSCKVSYSLRGPFTPNIRRSLPARLYVFITQSNVLITQLDKNLTLAWLMISYNAA